VTTPEYTVLIVEDEPKIAALLNDYLQKEGFATHWFDTGTPVTDWVRENSPDLLLLDLMLPGKDGMAICREVRAFSQVPIIMVTARVDEIDRLLGLELGADDYICKPFSPREVVARVTTVNQQFSIPRNPQLAATTTPLEQFVYNGIMLNGVPLDLLSAGCYDPDSPQADADADGNTPIGCSTADDWLLEPLGTDCGFGVEVHNAHVQPNGSYH